MNELVRLLLADAQRGEQGPEHADQRRAEGAAHTAHSATARPAGQTKGTLTLWK